jgi:PAS domain S-box-containing protein
MVMRSIRLRSRNSRLLETLKAEIESARETNKRYRALVESSRELTVIFSPEGRVVYASPSAHTLLGENPETLLGATTKDLLHPDDLREFRTAGEKSLAKLGEPYPLPHVCVRSRDGGYVPLAGKIANMLYVPGVEGFVFTASRLDPDEHRRLHAAE